MVKNKNAGKRFMSLSYFILFEIEKVYAITNISSNVYFNNDNTLFNSSIMT